MTKRGCLEKLGYIPPMPERILNLTAKMRQVLMNKHPQDGDGFVVFGVVNPNSPHYGKKKTIVGGRNFSYTVSELLRGHIHVGNDRLYPVSFCTVRWVYPAKVDKLRSWIDAYSG